MCVSTHVYKECEYVCICAYVYREVFVYICISAYVEVYTDSVVVPECYTVLKVSGNKQYRYLFCAVSLPGCSVLPLAMIKKGVWF